MILRMSSNACVRDEWARSFSALSDIVGPAAGCDRAEPARQLRALLCIPFPAPMSRACHTIGSFPLGLPALRPERKPEPAPSNSGSCPNKFVQKVS